MHVALISFLLYFSFLFLSFLFISVLSRRWSSTESYNILLNDVCCKVDLQRLEFISPY